MFSINRNIRVRVKPAILKGIRISQMMGNKNIATIASGQQIANRIQSRVKPINVLMPEGTQIPGHLIFTGNEVVTKDFALERYLE